VNALYYGDNLDILRRYIKDETVDLVYLDPPFNSQANYNVLFAEQDGTRSAAQIKAFEDTWRWDESAAEAYQQVVEQGGRVSDALQAFRKFLGDSDMLAYLSMMAPRLRELRRVLKPAGSIYLHCDPTASHYLKMLMDGVFGPSNFQNEIVWHYRKWPSGKYTFQRNHDIILFYSRGPLRDRVFNQLYMERAASTLKRFGRAKIVSGHDESGKRVPSQTLEEESEGVRMDDVWGIGRVPPIKQLYPTEKPPALLERIITASSNDGQTVLDPFCGCGTTIVAAQRLKRRWIGIDITHLAITLIKHRLLDAFGAVKFEVLGEPVSLTDAQALAGNDPYQFQWWALGLVGARPTEQKKGADKGIDGRLYFHDEPKGKTKQIIFSVKAGHVNVSQVRDLRGVLDREKAEIGALLTLEPSTQPMRSEAASAGFYQAPSGKRYPRIQILTVGQLLEGKGIEYPPEQERVDATFKKAPRVKSAAAENGELQF
jgi:DNA modification methylase